ncbi:hypothetical protein CDAR_243381 [Caerostris darwini]|uniref:Uncharacterized protein n=1 Tax=Caerostris darwini TaxID=1538125 RepID=A0AAV4RGL7_9ARAC|nr:hypothetical protein CDAR_243381 [Caerostris darwini]
MLCNWYLASGIRFWIYKAEFLGCLNRSGANYAETVVVLEFVGVPWPRYMAFTPGLQQIKDGRMVKYSSHAEFVSSIL